MYNEDKRYSNHSEVDNKVGENSPSNSKVNREKFYKKTWFLIVAGVVLFMSGYYAGMPISDETEEVTDVNSQESSESEEQTTPPVPEEDSATTVVEENPVSEEEEEVVIPATPVDLTTGTWTCGVDIAPGKYVATAEQGAGCLEIDGSTYVLEYLTARNIGPDYYGTDDVIMGVPSVTFTIEEGDTIEITGLPSVHFEPVE